MKSKFFKKLEIKKVTISSIKGGITDPELAGSSQCQIKESAKCDNRDPDHTRGCPSWNVSC